MVTVIYTAREMFPGKKDEDYIQNISQFALNSAIGILSRIAMLELKQFTKLEEETDFFIQIEGELLKRINEKYIDITERDNPETRKMTLNPEGKTLLENLLKHSTHIGCPVLYSRCTYQDEIMPTIVAFYMWAIKMAGRLF